MVSASGPLAADLLGPVGCSTVGVQNAEEGCHEPQWMHTSGIQEQTQYTLMRIESEEQLNNQVSENVELKKTTKTNETGRP